MEGQSLTQGGLLIHWESQHFLSFVSAQFPGFTARSVVRENHDRLTSKKRIHPTYDAENSIGTLIELWLAELAPRINSFQFLQLNVISIVWQHWWNCYTYYLNN